ncbi:MAG: VCBS repeat-containing protein [Sedimentisphaerales bacterium]|nr:VCBS repeat-containing protein [Sedimentisphaerales bacterium]
MLLRKAIFTTVFVSMILGNLYAQQADSDDISAYYGFNEIDIIKLDWGIHDLRVADFNGDGQKDIALTNNRRARIELLLQKEAIGPGEKNLAIDPNDIDVNAITPPTRFEQQSIAVSEKLQSLVCGDLNSDGWTDLAYYGEPKALYVLLQKAEEDTADKSFSTSWPTKKKINIDDGLPTSNALVCADLSNDGADDLALAGRDSIYIIVQTKDGSLAEPVKYPTSAQTLGIEIGDLNGDNINDLILVTNDMEKPLHVRFGLKTGQLGPQLQFAIERPFALILHDIDKADGDEVLAVDSLSGRLVCYRLAAEDSKDADWPILLYPLASGQEDTKRDLVLGDFDGDGLVDLTISDPGAAELIFYKQTKGLGLAEPVRFPAFADITSLSAVDIDSDGKTELGVLSLKEKVIGISRFEDDRLSFPKPVTVTGEPVAMELADINGDGVIDCLYVSRSDKDVRTLRAVYNLAATEKADRNELELELKKLSANPDGLKVLDVDQDGLMDVLIFVSYEPPILVRQVKKNKFEVVDSPNAQSSLIKDASRRSISVANVDGKDGDELLIAQNNFARSLVFSDGQTWNVVDQYNAKSTENQISVVAAFALETGTQAERPSILLLDGQKGQLQILKAGSDKTYRVEKVLDVGNFNSAAHMKMLFAPLTGNDVESLLLFDSKQFAIVTPPTNNKFAQHMEQQFAYETKIKDGIYGNLAAGDINSDGLTDVIMVEYGRSHIEILTFDADEKPVPAMRFKILEEKSYRDSKPGPKASAEPRELTVADVTGDGKDDLVTVIHDRIIIYPQD